MLRDDNKISQLPRLDRAFCFFAAPRVRSAERVTFDRLRQRDSLLRHPTALGFSFRRLAGHGHLQTLPGIQRHDVPVAAERQMASGLGDTIPAPSARGTVW